MTLIANPALGPWPLLGYVESPLDRAAHLRGGAAGLISDPRARFYLLGGEFVAMRQLSDWLEPLFPLEQVQAMLAAGDESDRLKTALFLGLADGAPHFAVAFDPGRKDALAEAGFAVNDLRSIAAGGLLPPGHLTPIACGKALLAWHARHRFCANCGQPSRITDAGWRRDCPACGAQHFPRTDPVVIMLTASGDRCLLGRQPNFAPGMWSCLAGFVEPGETVEDAVRRETLEEAGVTTGRVLYRSCQPWPFPMSLMMGFLAEATSTDITIDPKELEAARWFDRDEAAALLTHTHPQGLFAPAPVAIAHHLIRAFVEGARA